MLAGPVELVLGDVGSLPAASTGYVFPAAPTIGGDAVATLAAALGVEGDPVPGSGQDGTTWTVGPTDGTAPSLMVSNDAQGSWWYSAPWAQRAGASGCLPGPTTSMPGPPVTVLEPTTVLESCAAPAPTPPQGVPDPAEAAARARQLIAALGADPDAMGFEVHADVWSAFVITSRFADGAPSPMQWVFSFGTDGVLQSATGQLAIPEPVGPYALIDVEAAFERLQAQQIGPWAGGTIVDVPAVEPAAPLPMPTTTELATFDPPASTEPVGAQPMPSVGAPVPAPAPPADLTPIVVTLVDVESDLWWATDADGSVWQVPAYRFIGDDGGWYTVPAVTDEYLIAEPPRPIPTTTPPNDPLVSAVVPTTIVFDITTLEPLVGRPLDEFTAAAEALGGTVRVVEADGVQLGLTDDFRPTRVNVAVEGGSVARIVDTS